MTPRRPCDGLTLSNVLFRQRNLHRARVSGVSRRLFIRSSSRTSATQRHHAASKPSELKDPIRAALTAVETGAFDDPINPPRSTLPPPLDLPTRGEETRPVYWYRIGRAYGTFYKDGIKAVWNNWSAAKLLKQKLSDARIEDAIQNAKLTRAEFQMLARNGHDVGKLPFFGLLVLVFGEWLPLLVPFIPNAVPGTCRIPKQIRGMREKAEERRRQSFRLGISEPAHEQLPPNLPPHTEEPSAQAAAEWSIAFDRNHRQRMLQSLRPDQLLHLSTTLGLHASLWDRLQLAPPTILLRRRIGDRLAYLAQDDTLLLRAQRSLSDPTTAIATRLSPSELELACADRGLDILGRPEQTLRASLAGWLQRQREDRGRGRAVMVMLFRRPKAWDTEAGLNAPSSRR